MLFTVTWKCHALFINVCAYSEYLVCSINESRWCSSSRNFQYIRSYTAADSSFKLTYISYHGMDIHRMSLEQYILVLHNIHSYYFNFNWTFGDGFPRVDNSCNCNGYFANEHIDHIFSSLGFISLFGLVVTNVEWCCKLVSIRLFQDILCCSRQSGCVAKIMGWMFNSVLSFIICTQVQRIWQTMVCKGTYVRYCTGGRRDTEFLHKKTYCSIWSNKQVIAFV